VLSSHTDQGTLLVAYIQTQLQEVAAVSRHAHVFTALSDESMMCCVDSVPGALIVISGYWTGPDADDGSGSVEAMIQRIA